MNPDDKKKLEKLQNFLVLLNDGLTKEDFVKSFQNVVAIVTQIGNKLLSDNVQIQENFDALKKQLAQDNTSDLEEIKTQARLAVGSAITGMLADVARRMDSMQQRIDNVQNGRDADEQAIFAKLVTMLPTIDQLRQDLPTMGPAIRDSLELLSGNDRLDIGAIRGMEELMQKIEAAQKNGSNLRIVGARSGFLVYINGVKEGMLTNVNFAAGTGMTIAYSKVNGQPTITFSSSGSGGGGSKESPVEAVGGGNTVFTFATKPDFIVADGTTYFEGFGYTWSSGASQATMSIAPSEYIQGIIL